LKLPQGGGFPVRNIFVLYCAPYPAYKAGPAGALPVNKEKCVLRAFEEFCNIMILR